MPAERDWRDGFVVMGVSGSGKTTVGQLLAQAISADFHDADAFHPPANVAKMSTGQALTDIDCSCITELSTFEVAGLPVTAIPMLPHTRRSLVYHVGSVLFTGLIMHAGTVGDAPNSYAEALLAAGIIDHLFDYPEETPILPALGPPSNVRCERALNPWLREFLENHRL
ncbi:MAG: shikimate kinase [Alkalispirochaetaceae bacterium]